MRFNPQETTGSRVRLRYSVELHYELAGPAEFLLLLHAARTARQTVVEESFDLTPFQPSSLETDPVSGNRIAAFSASSRELSVRYAAVVDLEHEFVDPADVIAESPAGEKNIHAGDIILTVQGNPVTTPEDVAKHLDFTRKAGKKIVALLIRRGNDTTYVAVKL